MTGEQYKITGIAQVDTIRHKWNFWTEPVKFKRYFKVFCEDSANVSRPSHLGKELCAELFNSVVMEWSFIVEKV